MGQVNNPVALLIKNIKEGQKRLEEKTKALSSAKQAVNEITKELKEYKKDLTHMYKYMTDEQKSEVASLKVLSPDTSRGKRGSLNPISEVALDAIMKSDGHQLTNGELYAAYLDTVPGADDALSYTQFNIKIRQLFTTGRLEKEQVDPKKASRIDVIRLRVETDDN